MLLKETFLLQGGDAGAGVLQLHGLGGGAARFVRRAHAAAGRAEVEGLARQAAAARGEHLVGAGQRLWRLQAQALLLRSTGTQDQRQLVLLAGQLLTHSPGLRLALGRKEKNSHSIMFLSINPGFVFDKSSKYLMM